MSSEHSEKDALTQNGYYDDSGYTNPTSGVAGSVPHSANPPPGYDDTQTAHAHKPSSSVPPPAYGGYVEGYQQAYSGYSSNNGYSTNNGYNSNTTVVNQPGRRYVKKPSPPVPDYLALSIVSVFFCTCCGIYSIAKSVNARNMKDAGSYERALDEASSARNAAIAAIVIGLVLTLLYVCFQLGVFAG